ncbi:hypothetical protein PV326_009247 [Microctonus aethiopoides]|uniref:Metallo-beta-lactamase domain-containing protein 1 n=1 Tax=Microctonus aethiopoides TaxID=144406 RepID=A0AA39FL89_9HYME|nr:hypothetical protein PV326_009247 [Microctonus aethiopoides]KAK0171538.1 hypothetical protein PV328_004983 [Microctonus aethiopoides]
MNEVIILFEGYSNDLGNGKLDANCSCTLIKGLKNVIVDTMTAWDRQKLIDALKSHYISPEDINYVVCTHSHADHIGNNNLFTNADQHIIGSCIQNRTRFHELIQNQTIVLCDGIVISTTPGHTYDDVTVHVDTKVDDKKARIAITGDLFENELDIFNPLIWKKLGRPELVKTQAKNRLAVITWADYIVPGHGPMFKVTDQIRQLLSDQINEFQ